VNLIVLTGFLLGCLSLLWIAQALALWRTGQGSIWVLPYRHESESVVVRWTIKLALHAGILSVLICFPWTMGFNPWQYHLKRFTPVDWPIVILGLGVTIWQFMIPFVINLTVGWIEISRRYGAVKLAFKIGKSFLIPIPLTLVEEALFRGIVLESFLIALPGTVAGQVIAVLTSSLIFAAVHFVHPQKHSLPALGLFVLGIVLSLAYLRTGHNLQLPFAIHAGGVWFIQATRPITRYRGPSWLIGYSSYPICGGMGLTMMVVGCAIVLAALGR
jgi:hypothetical protein